MNLQLVTSFLLHKLTSKTRHGTHSPFVYRLADEVIYDHDFKNAYQPIEDLRRLILQDETSIEITDLGAGSHVNNNKQKQVKQIAKNALKPPALAQLIYRLANDLRPRNIIELGTCLGITTAYLARAVPSAKVISVEGCPQTAHVATQNLKALGIENAKLLTGNFDLILPQIIEQEDFLDFVFVDGNHRKDATLNYFKMCLPKVHQNSIMIFDDIYWSKGMKEAWEEIKDHPKVTVTVDLFWIGLVFFKQDQIKEHFKLNFKMLRR